MEGAWGSGRPAPTSGAFAGGRPMHTRRSESSLDTDRVMTAFAAAPVVAVALGLVWFLGIELLDGPGGLNLWPGVPMAAFVAFTYGLVCAAAATVVVAVPCYLLARATVGVSGRIARVVGTLIGAYVAYALVGHWSMVVAFGIAGWTAAAVWWRVASGVWTGPVPPSGSTDEGSGSPAEKVDPPAAGSDSPSSFDDPAGPGRPAPVPTGRRR